MRLRKRQWLCHIQGHSKEAVLQVEKNSETQKAGFLNRQHSHLRTENYSNIGWEDANGEMYLRPNIQCDPAFLLICMTVSVTGKLKNLGFDPSL